MKITPIPYQLRFDLRLGIQKSSGGPRSPGLHLSDIYNTLLKELHPERYERFADDQASLELFGEVGFCVEHIVERGFKGRHTERPEEHRSEEGIIISPDLLIFEENGDVRIGELKAAWMSSREVPRVGDLPGFGSFPPKFDKYLIQVKGYCHVLGTPLATLVVFFVNGPYDCKNRDQDLKPEILAWDLTFSPMELEENWRILIAFAKQKGWL